MNLIIKSINAITLAGLAEGMVLGYRIGIPQKDLLYILSLTSLKCPMIQEKGKGI